MRGLPRRGALARAPVGRRPLFYRGDSRRKRRGAAAVVSERGQWAIWAIWVMWAKGGWGPNYS